MKTSIIIPTRLSEKDAIISDLIFEIKNTATTDYELFITSLPGSAAQNRNRGLNLANGDIIIHLDDDITGLKPRWDEVLIQPLLENPDIIIVSAELMPPGVVTSPLTGYQIINRTVVASALIAHRRNPLRFDEAYVGSGMEDNDWCMQMYHHYPRPKIAINFDCKVIHKAEKKGRTEENWSKNRVYYNKKWKQGRLFDTA